MNNKTALALAASIVPVLAGTAIRGYAQSDAPTVLKGRDAFGSWRDDRPGLRRLFSLGDLPPIGENTGDHYSQVVPRPAGAMPQVPRGFTIAQVASGLKEPRVIRTAPNGDLFVSDSAANIVRVYRVPAKSSKPQTSAVFATGLKRPYGIGFYPPGANPRWVYVANVNGVVRFPYKSGDLKARGPAQTIVSGIPVAHHWTRDIVFTPDGKTMFLSVGSGSNVALDMYGQPQIGWEAWKKTKPMGAAWDTEAGRADILSFDPMGGNRAVYATGLRNASGLALAPGQSAPWCVVNERDGLGDNTPFDYATQVKKGGFYGWPWFYMGDHQDPRHAGERSDLKAKITVPQVLIQGHSAPLQIAFYNGSSFPAAYKGSAFVTLHGSWNREPRTGYKLVRLLFDAAGQPTGEYEDFVTGFVVGGAKVWGRPVGVTVGKDGSLFLTEDGNGTIWRIAALPTPATAGR